MQNVRSTLNITNHNTWDSMPLVISDSLVPTGMLMDQNLVVIWEKRALKSVVGVPVPSGFEAMSNALNLASSKFSACTNIYVLTRKALNMEELFLDRNIWKN